MCSSATSVNIDSEVLATNHPSMVGDDPIIVGKTQHQEPCYHLCDSENGKLSYSLPPFSSF